MRKRLVIITIVVLLAGGAFFALRREKVYKPTSGTTIIAFGDSLVAGQGASVGKNFPAVLSRKLGVNIINAGKNGDTTVSALSRLESDVLRQDPKVVIVLLGGNDFFQRIPLPTTLSNLSSIIDQIKSRGAVPILVGFNNGLLFKYNSEFKKLAKQKEIPYIANAMEGIFDKPELMSDSIHPNDLGYEKMAEKIVPTLEKMLK